ncbi:MAG: ParB/RepB/Spo0J family partition protein [Betaproteobacteria bacterium]|jgi:ParB-like partition proteins|nr:ParB/RepB/Spo0J family partition protein [Betaproteobacteria bacterium]
MSKLRGLGKGLDALLGEDTQRAVRDFTTLPVTELQPGRFQPRQKIDERSLEELASSIRAHGILQPILVRSLKEGGGYEIIAGERRWRAAEIAGLEAVPVLIREMADEATMAVALIENLQRENLNVLEEAQGLQRLIKEFGLTHEEVARSVGKSRSAVSNLLRMLELSESVRSLLMDDVLDMGHARALLPLNEKQQYEVAMEIVDKQWSVRQTEQRVKALLKSVVDTTNSIQAENTKITPRWSDWLSKQIGVDVTIKTNQRGNGTIAIHFSNPEEMEAIIWKIGKDEKGRKSQA